MPGPKAFTVAYTNVPADILTYRYQNRMVYVTPPKTYEEALDFAQKVFPELKDVDRESISFQMRAHTGTAEHPARIAPMAWQQILGILTRFEILEIQVRDADPPPNYDAPSVSSEKSKEHLSPDHIPRSHSRSPSLSKLAGLLKGRAPSPSHSSDRKPS